MNYEQQKPSWRLSLSIALRKSSGRDQRVTRFTYREKKGFLASRSGGSQLRESRDGKRALSFVVGQEALGLLLGLFGAFWDRITSQFSGNLKCARRRVQSVEVDALVSGCGEPMVVAVTTDRHHLVDPQRPSQTPNPKPVIPLRQPRQSRSEIACEQLIVANFCFIAPFFLFCLPAKICQRPWQLALLSRASSAWLCMTTRTTSRARGSTRRTRYAPKARPA